MNLTDSYDPLEHLVTLVDLNFHDQDFHQPHMIVGVEGDVLYFVELEEGAHPIDVLAIMPVPPGWTALGLVAFGWAAPPMDVPGFRPSLAGDRKRVRVTMFVDRTGRAASTATLDDGTTIDEPGHGAISELLRAMMTESEDQS